MQGVPCRAPEETTMGVILLGDKTAAARWLAYAKSRAAALAKQGNNLSQTFSPAEGVTIRVQTLQGTPRVWIEAGGMDYIASDYDPAHPLAVPTDSTLYGGKLLSGSASPAGKSPFGRFAGHNLYPLGGNEFLGGPPQHTFSGAVQLVTVKGGKIASGQAFSPWQDPAYSITGVRAVLHSGMVDSGLMDDLENPVYKKRMHVLYQYSRTMPHSGTGSYRITQPAIATSVDGGWTFSITPFVINIEATVGFPGDYDPENFQNVDIREAIFCGDNRIALIGRAYGPDIRWNEGSNFIPTTSGSVCTLTSDDGGATWAIHYAPQTWGTLPNPIGSCYIGGSKVLGVLTNFGGLQTPRETYLSTDCGATFSLVEGPTVGAPDLGYSDVVCLGADSAAYYRFGNFYRTHDAGATWEVLPVPAEVNNFEPGRIVLRNTPSTLAPDPPALVADYASIVMLTAVGQTDRVALSVDGGRTWRKGGVIPKRVPNVGLLDRALPAFPAFPDLHKNGLPIP